LKSSAIRTARDWLWIGGFEPSSKKVTSPFGRMRPSCCHAVSVPGPILKSS
jgi:hypothetical protein